MSEESQNIEDQNIEETQVKEEIQEESSQKQKDDSASFARKKYNAGRDKVYKDFNRVFGTDYQTVDEFKDHFDTMLEDAQEGESKEREAYKISLANKDKLIEDANVKAQDQAIENSILSELIKGDLKVNDLDYLKHKINSNYKFDMSDGKVYDKSGQIQMDGNGEFANIGSIIKSMRDNDEKGILFEQIQKTSQSVKPTGSKVTEDNYRELLGSPEIIKKITDAGYMQKFEMSSRAERIEILKRFV